MFKIKIKNFIILKTCVWVQEWSSQFIVICEKKWTKNAVGYVAKNVKCDPKIAKAEHMVKSANML